MELPYRTFSIADGPTGRNAQWPPKVISVQTLGYIVDKSGLSYPRDIGRSSSFGDANVLFNFGDTFAHDVTGKYISSTSSTLAVAMNTERLPTVTAFRPDKDGVIPSFIPFLETEKEQYGKRTTLRCFGGIVESDGIDSIGDVAAGWVFYQKGTHYHIHTDEHVFEYTGVAKVKFDVITKQVWVKRVEDPLVLFEKYEPRFGTFSTVRQGDFAHLFGHTSDEQSIMLARVNTRSVVDRSRYTYWDGKKYQPNLAKAKSVINNMQHGAIYCSKLFEQNKGRDWVFIGCSRFRDSKVRIGVSANLEGPFTMIRLINAAPLFPMPSGWYMYCIYPHPWAFKEEEGQLMITWSEGTPQGNVVAVKLQFAMTMEMGRPSERMKRHNSYRENKCVIL